jgi:hypothetical protein
MSSPFFIPERALERSSCPRPESTVHVEIAVHEQDRKTEVFVEPEQPVIEGGDTGDVHAHELTRELLDLFFRTDNLPVDADARGSRRAAEDDHQRLAGASGRLDGAREILADVARESAAASTALRSQTRDEEGYESQRDETVAAPEI